MKPKDLKKWREENDYSQAKLARTLQVDVMTVSRWERGVYEIPHYLSLALKCLSKECRK